MIDGDNLKAEVEDFVVGLLRFANISHAGNCLVMSQILHRHLLLFSIKTKVINVEVKQGKKTINHYCLLQNNGLIIDATASQFKGMPQVFIGEMPLN